MRFGKVRIALDHLQGLVAKHIGNLGQRGAVHGKIACGAMPEVVKTEVLYVGLLEGRLPGLLHIFRFLPVCLAGKKKVGVYGSDFVVCFEKICGMACQDNHTNFPILGVINGNPPLLEVNLRPSRMPVESASTTTG